MSITDIIILVLGILGILIIPRVVAHYITKDMKKK